MRRSNWERAYAYWTLKDVEHRMQRCRGWGQITPNGVVYDEWLVNVNGAGFVLFGKGKTDAELEDAVRYLRGARDVVTIYAIDW